jgi:hypothetical protein
MKEKVEFERLQAKDKDGVVFNIIGYQYLITHTPVYGRPIVLRGDIEYWTDSGLPARKIDARTFRIYTVQETSTRFLDRFTLSNNVPRAIEVYASAPHE